MKVILHKLFPYAPYLNEYIGFEMDMPEGCDPIAAVESLRKLAEQSHRERYPSLYPNGNEEIVTSFAPPIAQVEKPIRDTVDNIIEDINSCKDEIVLKSYQLIAKKDERIMNAYNEKLKSFQ